MKDNMHIKKNTTEKWTGSYRGVNFEICKNIMPPNSFKPNEQIWWTHYINIFIERIPQEFNPTSFWLKGRKDKRFGRIFYDYYKHSVINAIEFHGGCTWYSKEHGFDGDTKVIKIGCDYQHLWDESKYYTLDYVKSEVQKTIDSFLLLIPTYKYRCCGNGKLYSESEGIIKDGQFCSMEYYGKEQWFIDYLKNKVEAASN